jgi:hypothetical protein
VTGGRSKKRRSKRKRPTVSAIGAARTSALEPAESSFVGAAFAVVVALAALVRLAATRNDLWIDEIWTLKLVEGLQSPLEIFTVRHDNNHILNSLIVYALRPFGIDWLYRVPEWLAGIATVGLGAWVTTLGDDGQKLEDASPRNRALIAAILLGGAYLLVHYGSEARGYSLALAFGLLGVGTTLADGPRPWSRRAPVAWVALVLAMLALAFAVHFLVALVAWSAVRTLRRGGWRYAAATLVWWYAVPIGVFAIFYFGFLRVMERGGGTRGGTLASLARAFGAAMGLPGGVPAPVVLTLAVTVTAFGVAWLAARRSDLWILYVVGMVVSPVAVILFHKSQSGRHFIVSATLWLLLAARLLAWLTTRGRTARAIVAIMLAAFLLGNALRTMPLIRYGRGTFRDALRYIASHTPRETETVRVTGDHDFRNRMVVEYYAPRVDRRLRYVGRRERSEPGSDWYIGSLPPPPGGVPHVVADARGNAYRFETEFPSNPFAGISWRLYRRARETGVPR